VASIKALTQKASASGVRVFALDVASWRRSPTPRHPSRSSRPCVSSNVTSLRFRKWDWSSSSTTFEIRQRGDDHSLGRRRGANRHLERTVGRPFNPKTLRASAGSIFHLPVVVASFDETVAYFGGHAPARDRRARGAVTAVDFTKACVVVIGNEADGLDAATIERCNETISIPMEGRSESLNAGVAAS